MAREASEQFDISTEMRTFAEKSVEQAKEAFNSFISAAQTAVSTAESQAKNAHSGAKQVSELAVDFAQRNIASSFEFAEKAVRARDAQELTRLHADYVSSQVAALTDQAKALSRQAANLAGSGTRH